MPFVAAHTISNETQRPCWGAVSLTLDPGPEDRMAAIGLPDAAYLRECFEYDPESGVLTWKRRPVWHFKGDRYSRSWNTRYAGTTAGDPLPTGYLKLQMHRQPMYVHRIIWAIQTGAWPTDEIDHQNRVKADNRWDNLRAMTRQQNARNMPGREAKTGLPKGVERSRKRYVARATISGRVNYIGSYDTPEEASKAYRAFKAERDETFFSGR